MILRGLLAGFAAIVLSATLPLPAEAYPTYVRNGTQTVYGGYRPIDFTFSVIENEQSYITVLPDPSQPPDWYRGLSLVSVSLLLGGYGVQQGTEDKFDAGLWRMKLLLGGILEPEDPDLPADQDRIMRAYALDGVVAGTLDLVALPDGGYPAALGYNETPQDRDRFLLYGRQDCSPGDLRCEVLTLNLGADGSGEDLIAFLANDALTHVGPFVPCRQSVEVRPYTCNFHFYNPLSGLFLNPVVFGYQLDGGLDDSGRTSLDQFGQECRPGLLGRCTGGVRSEGEFASSRAASPANVPEPGTLALFGLGLAGLGLRRRSQQKGRSA